MPLDLRGGLAEEDDEVTADVPSSSSYREGVSLWLWDDAGRFGLPRIGVEAVGATWERSFGTALCMATPDERLVLASQDATPLPVADGEGRSRVLGAGPLRFECLEPFARWRVDFDGDAVAIGVHDYLAEGIPKPALGEVGDVASVRLQVDAQMVGPPWVQGSHDPEGAFVSGEHRFEQLCTVAGEMEVDGTTTSFTGGGLRVHRKGGKRSDYGDFHGHVWQSARFPSGRAFGFIHYRPRPDGSVKYREGWLLDAGEVVPARVESTPWMTDVQPSGEDVGFTLDTPEGDVHIEGETFVSAFRPPRPTAEGTVFPLLQSGIARYRWGEEEAYGMIERSARLEETQ